MINILNSKHKRIGTTVYFTIIFIVFLPLCFLLLVSSWYMQDVLYKKIIDIDKQTLGETHNRIVSDIEDIIGMAQIIRLESNVRIVLESADSKYTDMVPYYNASNELASYFLSLQSATFLRYNNVKIRAVDLYGNVYSSWPRQGKIQDMPRQFISKGYFEAVLKKRQAIYWFTFTDNDGKPQISMVQPLDGESSKDMVGILMISIPEDDFRNLTLGSNYLDEGDCILVVDSNGNIISGLNQEIMENAGEFRKLIPLDAQKYGYIQATVDQRKKLISYMPIKNTTWTLVKISDYENSFLELSNLRWFICFVAIIIFLLTSVVLFLMIYNLVNPVKKLTVLMKHVENGDFSVSIPVKGRNEITELSMGFNKMVGRIQDLIVTTKLQEKEQQTLRLEVLHAQINPHFLFNTLNTIKWIAIMNQVPKVAMLIENLGHILEMSIRNIEKLISVNEEITNVQCYLELQKARMNSDINVTIIKEPGVERLLIPKMILQPIVENTLVHGFAKSGKKQVDIRVQISVKIVQEQLVFHIQDNGAGISDENLLRIQNEINSNSHKNKEGHIGLQNVHKRIQLRFGEPYGIEILSKESKGTTVLIRLPAVGKEESN